MLLANHASHSSKTASSSSRVAPRHFYDTFKSFASLLNRLSTSAVLTLPKKYTVVQKFVRLRGIWRIWDIWFYLCLPLTSPDSDCPSKSRTHPQLLYSAIGFVRGRQSSSARAEKVVPSRSFDPQTNDVVCTSEPRNEGQDHLQLEGRWFSGSTRPCCFSRRMSRSFSQETGELHRQNRC
jgi:hypothetical protein